jgi:hypothetical protein
MDYESRISIDKKFFAILENNTVQVTTIKFNSNIRYGTLVNKVIHKHFHSLMKKSRNLTSLL